MSIRPIDVQITIQKSDHYSKEYNYNNQLNNSQQAVSSETQRQVIQSQQQVLSAESTKNSRINRDGSKKSDDRKFQPQNKKSKKDDDSKAKISLAEDDKGAFVDIII